MTCPFLAPFFEIENLNVMRGNVLSFLKYSSISSALNLVISNKLIFHFWTNIVMIIFLITLVRGYIVIRFDEVSRFFVELSSIHYYALFFGCFSLRAL